MTTIDHDELASVCGGMNPLVKRGLKILGVLTAGSAWGVATAPMDKQPPKHEEPKTD